MVETFGLLILPSTWSKLNSGSMWVKMAEIRASSKKPGEIRFRNINTFSSLLLCDTYTAQKRWYKCLITYNQAGVQMIKKDVEMLYLNIEPWVMRELLVEPVNKE